MQVIIESPGVHINEKLEKLIHQKFEHFSKIYERITKCTVILKKEKDDHNKNHIVEAQLSVSKKLLFASEHDESFEIALQKVIDGLAHQLQKYKDERQEVR